MTLVPGEKKTSLNIADFDFVLFKWSITHYLNECFDEYGEYEFSKTQWNAILAEAEKLVSFKSFDALFEYAASFKIYSHRIIGGGRYSVTLNNMNCCGAEFWKKIDNYKIQLKDMKAWTELVLYDNESMKLYGI